MLMLMLGCMAFDGFFFDPTPVDAYELSTDVVPAELLEPVTFSSEDGTELHGVWAWQADRAAADTLMFCHGNMGNLDFHMDRLELFWGYGYNIFLFDYRGYGMSQGSPDHEGVLMDGRAAVTKVLADSGLGSSRELLMQGVSMGGHVCLSTAGASPPRALIIENSFSSGENLGEAGGGVNLPEDWLFEDEWDNISAAQRLDEVPLMLVHGDSDTYVQPEHSELIYASAHDPKELWLVPGGNHGPVVDSLRNFQLLPELYQERVMEWFAAW